MKRSLAALALPLLVLAGCGEDGGESESKTFTVKGMVTLADGSPAGGTACAGLGGYRDINFGAQVTIQDASSETLGLGSLGAGETSGLEREDGSVSCTFDFEIPDIPERDGIYSIKMGNRDAFSFKREDAGNLSLTLGN